MDELPFDSFYHLLHFLDDRFGLLKQLNKTLQENINDNSSKAFIAFESQSLYNFVQQTFAITYQTKVNAIYHHLPLTNELKYLFPMRTETVIALIDNNRLDILQQLAFQWPFCRNLSRFPIHLKIIPKILLECQNDDIFLWFKNRFHLFFKGVKFVNSSDEIRWVLSFVQDRSIQFIPKLIKRFNDYFPDADISDFIKKSKLSTQISLKELDKFDHYFHESEECEDLMLTDIIKRKSMNDLRIFMFQLSSKVVKLMCQRMVVYLAFKYNWLDCLFDSAIFSKERPNFQHLPKCNFINLSNSSCFELLKKYDQGDIRVKTFLSKHQNRLLSDLFKSTNIKAIEWFDQRKLINFEFYIHIDLIKIDWVVFRWLYLNKRIARTQSLIMLHDKNIAFIIEEMDFFDRMWEKLQIIHHLAKHMIENGYTFTQSLVNFLYQSQQNFKTHQFQLIEEMVTVLFTKKQRLIKQTFFDVTPFVDVDICFTKSIWWCHRFFNVKKNPQNLRKFLNLYKSFDQEIINYIIHHKLKLDGDFLPHVQKIQSLSLLKQLADANLILRSHLIYVIILLLKWDRLDAFKTIYKFDVHGTDFVKCCRILKVNGSKDYVCLFKINC